MTIINPATGETIQEISEHSPVEIEALYQAAKAARPAWAASAVADRVAVIGRFLGLLEEEKTTLAETLTLEMGKPLQQSLNEINGAGARIRYFIEHAESYLADEWVTPEGPTREKISYEPLGVIANISAWNYPYLVGTNVFIPALIAGNAVLYKPSEYSLLTGLHIQRLLLRAGVPAAVFPVIRGAAPAGEKLLSLPLDGYFFTGSYATGKYIAEKAAHKLVPVQLELGGKDPLYVAPDVEDIEAVARATADGAFYNNGQSCCSVERIYVHADVYDRYVAAFLKEVRGFKLGLPTEPGVYVGPVTRPAQLKLLRQQVEQAIQLGAVLECGGSILDRPGNYFAPTVLTSVTHAMDVMREESFGPIIGIMKVSGDDEAAQLMADTTYGLTASVYSRSRDRAEVILRQMNTGTAYWNCCDRVSAALPWSGRKHSGLGVTLGRQGLLAFVQPKAFHLRG